MKSLVLLIGAMAISFAMQGQHPDKYSRDGDKTQVIRYYEDGTVKEKGSFLNDKPDGKWFQYGINGNLQMEGIYEEGSKEGKWFVYSEDGEYLYEVFYENNSLKDSHRWKIEERNLFVSE